MKTEMANLPGKCLHKHLHQFKLSTCKLAQDFVFLVFMPNTCSNNPFKQLQSAGDNHWPFCSQSDVNKR